MRIFAALSLGLIGILMNACATSKTNQSDGYVTPWASVNTPSPNQPLDRDRISLTRIAFSSERYGLSQIFVMDADGSNVIRLTDADTMHILQSNQSAWSPDGQTLAVTAQGADMWAPEIYLVDVYTLEIWRITDNPDFDMSPTWSPDGRQIAFISKRNPDEEEQDSTDIYIMDRDGFNIIQLTEDDSYENSPTWSPDGSRIAFQSDREGNFDIYVMNADGSGITQLTDTPNSETNPAWSPDGTHIAYVGTTGTGSIDIYVMDMSSHEVTQITDDGNYEFSLAWSPDGTQIAFDARTQIAAHSFDIYVVNTDGSNLTQLTDSPGDDMFPTWEPLN